MSCKSIRSHVKVRTAQAEYTKSFKVLVPELRVGSEIQWINTSQQSIVDSHVASIWTMDYDLKEL